MNQPRALILSIALGSSLLSLPAKAQDFFQPGSVPSPDLLAPPASSVLQQATTPTYDATAYSSRNTNTALPTASDQGFAFLSPEEAAMLAGQAVGQPVTLAGVQVVLTPNPAAMGGGSSLVSLPADGNGSTTTVTTVTPLVAAPPLLTTPAGMDTGLTAVAIVNGVPVTSGPVTNLRSGYGNAGTTVNAYGGSILVSYGNDLPIVGPDYTNQLPGAGLSNPMPIPSVRSDQAASIAAAARSGVDSFANNFAMLGTFPIAERYAGPVPNIRPGAPEYLVLAADASAEQTAALRENVIEPFPTDQSGIADPVGANTGSPVNETKDAVQSFSRITESAATPGATTPQIAGTSDANTLVSSSNRDLTASGSSSSAASSGDSGGDDSTVFVSGNRSLSAADEAASAADTSVTPAVPAAAPAASGSGTGVGACDAQGILVQFNDGSNRFSNAQASQIRAFGEQCAAAGKGIQVIGYADADLSDDTAALRIVKGRVLRALHALTEAGVDDNMITRDTLLPNGSQPSNALVLKAN